MKNNMKKLMSFILMISLFCTFLSAIPSYADELQTELSDESQMITKYDIVLDEYFAGREHLYLSAKSDFDPERWEFIQEWKETLGGISFRSANIEWTITEVMSETTSDATLRIYEYISLVYVCNGYDVERNMKFGLDHILRLTKEDGGYQISSDTYIEPTGHKFGSSEDLAVFEAENATLADFSGDSIMMEMTASTTGNYTVNSNYDPQAAIDYSYQWNAEGVGSSGYNPQFYYYPGVDCCNFVSQCIYAGGMAMDSVWWTTLANASTPQEDDTENPAYSSVAWVNTASFKNHWAGTKGYYFTQVTDASQAIPGNPFFWLAANAGETYNHNMMIVDVDENGNIVTVNMHTGNEQEYSWTLGNEKNSGGYDRIFYTIDFAHNFVASQGNSHTCTLCGTTQTHDSTGTPSYTTSTHSPTCSGCGYEWPAVAHTCSYTNLGVDAGHKYACSGCSYAVIEAHDWKQMSTEYVCRKCSARYSPFVPIPQEVAEDQVTAE